MQDEFDKGKNSFTKEDLEKASICIASLIKKCEKSKANLSIRNSQYTLLKNRLEALNIALSLTNKELEMVIKIN